MKTRPETYDLINHAGWFGFLILLNGFLFLFYGKLLNRLDLGFWWPRIRPHPNSELDWLALLDVGPRSMCDLLRCCRVLNKIRFLSRIRLDIISLRVCLVLLDVGLRLMCDLLPCYRDLTKIRFISIIRPDFIMLQVCRVGNCRAILVG